MTSCCRALSIPCKPPNVPEGTAHAKSCLQIHWPVTGNVGPEVVPAIQQTWKAMEQLVKDVMPLPCYLVPKSCCRACVPCHVPCEPSAQTISYVLLMMPAGGGECFYIVQLALVSTGAGIVMLRACTHPSLGPAPFLPCFLPEGKPGSVI